MLNRWTSSKEFKSENTEKKTCKTNFPDHKMMCSMTLCLSNNTKPKHLSRNTETRENNNKSSGLSMINTADNIVLPGQRCILLPATLIPPVVVSSAAQQQLDTFHITAHREDSYRRKTTQTHKLHLIIHKGNDITQLHFDKLIIKREFCFTTLNRFDQ